MIFRDILSVVRRRWSVGLVCLVIGAIAGVAFALMSKPTYTSTARLLVATPHIDQSAQVPPGGITTQQRAVNYASMATGSTIVDQVIDELHLTQPPVVLLQNTRVAILPSTTVIQIAVDDTDAAQAQRIAHAFAAALLAEVPKVEKNSGAAAEVATITLTDDADLPAQPSSASRSSTVGLGVVAGVVVGALLMWLFEYMDTRVRDPRRLAAASGHPVLATIPQDPASGAGHLLTTSPEHGRLAESYRSLRAALQFVDVEGSAPVFTVVGASAGAGTSTVAANIAVSMGQAGQRTLLVDADLHRPRVAELLGVKATDQGLVGVLSGTAEASDAIQHWSDGGIDVLPAGAIPTRPTELVQSKAMDDLLDKLRGNYDVIVLDTPPLSEFTDGALLATASDGAILVASYGSTRADDIAAATARLDMLHGRLFGSVLVGVPGRSHSAPGVTPAPVPA